MGDPRGYTEQTLGEIKKQRLFELVYSAQSDGPAAKDGTAPLGIMIQSWARTVSK
ncbi:hypothetical protein GCM10022247_59830 [Allokutzneria multivorans]|uniref:Uncharacterized protein n=1 Tax=Allokutzneria multivorans TaxID=1142134 RepID=A0ABP7TJE0_9PSEU